MKSHVSLLTVAAATLAALAISPFTQAAQSERNEWRDLTASSGGTLTFKAMVGAIDLKTHDKDEVTYDALLKLGDGHSSQTADLIDLVEFDYQTAEGDVKITMKWKAIGGVPFSGAVVWRIWVKWICAASTG